MLVLCGRAAALDVGLCGNNPESAGVSPTQAELSEFGNTLSSMEREAVSDTAD
jgi:hypothetical protein